MKRILTTLAALAIGTSAHALVLSEAATPADSGETLTEENSEFVGDPVFDSEGVEIGTVSRVGLDANGDRKIMVMFDDHASTASPAGFSILTRVGSPAARSS